MKPSTYYFHMRMKILADFQICINVPLKITVKGFIFNNVWNVVTAMKLFIRIYFGLRTHLQLITKKQKGNFVFTINLKNIVYLH